MRFVVTTDLVDFDKLVKKIEEKKEKGEKFTFDQVAEEVAFEQQEVLRKWKLGMSLSSSLQPFLHLLNRNSGS